jgi:hypothetical protein
MPILGRLAHGRHPQPDAIDLLPACLTRIVQKQRTARAPCPLYHVHKRSMIPALAIIYCVLLPAQAQDCRGPLQRLRRSHPGDSARLLDTTLGIVTLINRTFSPPPGGKHSLLHSPPYTRNPRKGVGRGPLHLVPACHR